MDSCSPQLPLIDLADKTLTPGNSKWVEVRSDVRKALEEYGSFVASYDKVSWELQKSIVKIMEELFALPVEVKKRNVYPKPYIGYSTHNDNDLAESLGIQVENVNGFIQQLWPDGDGDESISKTIQLFAEKLVEIDVMVRKMVMESFGIEKYIIDEHLNSTNYRFRLLKYVAPPDVDADTTAKDNADVGVNVSIDADGARAEVNTDGDDGVDVANGVGANVGVKVNVDVNDDVKANNSVKAVDNVDVNVDAGVNGDANVDADANGDVAANSDANAGADGGANGDANVGVGGGVNANTDIGVNDNVNFNVDVKTGATTDAGDEDNDGAHADDTKLGLACHTDKNLLTVLYQHQIEGLDVKTKDGKWIRVKPSPNTFVVIAGDSLCALMNGRIPAPYHRVRVTEKKKTRYTAAIFTCPKPGYIIEAPKELVDEKHPRLFKPFDFRDLFTFSQSEAGRRTQSNHQSLLQPFCAVSEA